MDPQRVEARTSHMSAAGRLFASISAAAVAATAAPATASGDGLPAVGIDARPLSAPAGKVEYTTERGAKRHTRLIESARYGGPLRQRRLRGAFAVPAVAYDGSPAGVSADGRTLVLISPRTRFPRRATTFAVVDARRLAVRRLIRLRGDFSFDAISPDGRTMYLIEYSPRDFTNYAVRAYDMRASRLLPRPVVDPDEAAEPMTGVPVSRTTGPHGRWAYTLYQSAEHPFVHALDTERRTAVCIDLDHLKAVWNATLELRGERLEVVRRSGRVLAAIDTRTHRLVSAGSPEESGAGSPWLPIALSAAAVAVLLAFGVRRRPAARTA
jgi:hypothetical protein